MEKFVENATGAYTCSPQTDTNDFDRSLVDSWFERHLSLISPLSWTIGMSFGVAN